MLIISISALNFAEGFFNANCRVAQLLDAVKKRLKVPQSGIITSFMSTAETLL